MSWNWLNEACKAKKRVRKFFLASITSFFSVVVGIHKATCLSCVQNKSLFQTSPHKIAYFPMQSAKRKRNDAEKWMCEKNKLAFFAHLELKRLQLSRLFIEVVSRHFSYLFKTIKSEIFSSNKAWIKAISTMDNGATIVSCGGSGRDIGEKNKELISLNGDLGTWRNSEQHRATCKIIIFDPIRRVIKVSIWHNLLLHNEGLTAHISNWLNSTAILITCW